MTDLCGVVGFDEVAHLLLHGELPTAGQLQAFRERVAAIGEASERTEALLQGRRTWQVMAGAWPGRAGDPFADWINSVEKHVVSDTLSEGDLTWPSTSLIRSADLTEAVDTLRDRPGGDVNVMGSAQLVRWLLEADLVDEMNLMIEPILLGGGKGIFPADGNARPFELPPPDPDEHATAITPIAMPTTATRSRCGRARLNSRSRPACRAVAPSRA